VLSAASGEAGHLMVDTGYKVRGGESVVAAVAQTGNARSISDLSRERAAVRHPLLPGSRSELGLPLKTYNVLIGVLDVQSDQVGSFSEEDAAVLQLMADQLSVAIERTRVLQESDSHLRELERTYQGSTRQGWRTLLHARVADMIGYTYEGTEYKPLADVPLAAREALERGELVLLPQTNGAGRGAIMAVPIKLRGATIGAINLKVKDNVIPAETANLAQDISERLAQALEASWLLTESRARAEREKFISEMSAKIGAAPDLERILRTTVEELSNVVGDSPITIRLKSSAAAGEREQE
jgi:GAF domain-containing protein